LELIKKAADQGLVGLAVPQKFGGGEADWVTVGIAVEEMSKVDFGLGVLPVLPGLFSILFTRYCSEEMQQRYLPGMARGEISGCFAITEADCGSDVAAIRTKALRDGDHYIINGEKTGVSGGMDANIAVAPIKTNPQAGSKGISMFIIPLDLPGIARSRIPDMGFNQISRGTLFMDNVRLPAEYRIGEEGKGFYLIMGQFEVLRVFLSIAALGLAQVLLRRRLNMPKYARLLIAR
jgi:cyclohexanecarboxyl-CoA dehydrogenase